MRKLKLLLSFVVVLALMVSLSTGAFAASYTAASFDDLQTAFADNSGEDVDIDLTADVTATYNYLTAKDGIKYTIGTKNDSVLNGAKFNGDGNVKVNTDLAGTVEARGNVTVTVNGDINSGVYDGVSSHDSSSVTVTGNITAGDDGVYANDRSTVTVNGDINAGEDGVNSYEYSNVIVNGNITADDDGVNADDNSIVTVTGNITADDDGVDAEDDCNVTVNGDITAGDQGVDAVDDSTVYIDGNVSGGDGSPKYVDFTDPSDYSDGDEGVSAKDRSTVTVTGNVTGGKSYGHYGYGGTGVRADHESTVTVGGNVTGGDVYAEPLDSQENISRGGYGVSMYNSATVTVGGNVTGGSTNGSYGKGGAAVNMKMYNDSEGYLYVGGSASGGAGGTNGSAGSGLLVNDYYGYESIPDMYFGALDGIDFEFSESGDEALSDEDIQKVLNKIHIMGLDTEDGIDLFWFYVYMDICRAEQGDTVTAAAAHRTTVPVYVLRAAYEHGVTLVIEWNGGDDITVSDYDCQESTNILPLADLADLVKK